MTCTGGAAFGSATQARIADTAHCWNELQKEQLNYWASPFKYYKLLPVLLTDD